MLNINEEIEDVALWILRKVGFDLPKSDPGALQGKTIDVLVPGFGVGVCVISGPVSRRPA
ncbi:hypothetical protein ACFVFJ_46190 [Streptomyces sp. NPDC057717]|uniref:hypothetical protein n=1 Tax=Streptomyces sp. NPDC057717 TaxID=3346224 RepID=UPI0036A134EA